MIYNRENGTVSDGDKSLSLLPEAWLPWPVSTYPFLPPPAFSLRAYLAGGRCYISTLQLFKTDFHGNRDYAGGCEWLGFCLGQATG